MSDMDDKKNDLISNFELEKLLTDQIPLIPDELHERVELAVAEGFSSTKATFKTGFKYIAASFIGIILITVATLNGAVIAETIRNLPIFRSEVEELKEPLKQATDIGVYNAKENNFQAMEPIYWEKDGLEIEIDEIFLDETRLVYEVKFSGSFVDDAENNHDSVMYRSRIDERSKYPGDAIFIEGISSHSKIEGIYHIYRYETIFMEDELFNMLNEGLREFTIELRIDAHDKDGSGIELLKESVQLPIQAEKIPKSRKYSLLNTPIISSSYGDIHLEKFILSPTGIEILYEEYEEEGIKDIKLLNPVLYDENGNTYEDIHDNNRMWFKKFLFGPSFYYSDYQGALYLSYDGIGVLDESRFQKIYISGEEQEINYGGKGYIIPEVLYEDDVLRIKYPQVNIGERYHFRLVNANNLSEYYKFEIDGEWGNQYFVYEVEQSDEYLIEFTEPYIEYIKPGRVELMLEGDSHE